MSDKDLHTRLLRVFHASPYAAPGQGGALALARAAGLHHNTVYAALGGATVSTDTLAALARALNVPASLFTD